MNVNSQGVYTPLVGVLTQGNDGRYRVQPTAPVTFRLADNPRPAAPPQVPGRVRVASVPSLNYFSTVNTGGAESAAELERQRDKIVNGLLAMDPAVIAVTGVENNNSAALAELKNSLNGKSTPPGKFEYVNTGMLGMSPVASALLYQPALVQPVGSAKALNSGVDPRALTERNVPAIAQTFRLLVGARPNAQHFTVAVTHLKDRVTSCALDAPLGDIDLQDGQGNCNYTRLSMARAMLDWLAGNPTDDPTPAADRRVLIVGDFNAYPLEYPIQAMTNRAFSLPASSFFPEGLPATSRANYLNLVETILGLSSYSHVLNGQSGSLDHALANPALYRAINDAARWNINADEPLALDYKLDFRANGVSGIEKAQTQKTGYYSTDPVRMSDYDPLVIGFNPLCGDLNDDGVVDAADQAILVDAMNKTPVNRRHDFDLDGRITTNDLRLWGACAAQAR